MKTFVIVAFAVVIGLACAKPKPGEVGEYTTKYDNVDLDEILKSDRLLNNYFNCLMDKGNCTPDGQELKDILPDAIHSGCSKCSDKHKGGAKKITRFLIDNKPELWKQLEAKYDKEGTYKKKYKAELEKEGFKL